MAAVPATHGVIIVHEQDSGLGYPSVLVDAGKVIALLAASGEAPTLQGTAGNPGLRVQSAGTSTYVDGLGIANNPMGLGVRVDGAFAWIDRSRIVQNSGGGVLAESGASLVMRNCFIGSGGAVDTDAVIVNGSALDLVYTTVGGGAVISERTRALYCQGAAAVTARNSILVSLDVMPEVECAGATLTNTATEADAGMLSAMWFTNYATGDFTLTPSGTTAFADIAEWHDGDPATDINGDPRPDVDGSPDYAGADVP